MAVIAEGAGINNPAIARSCDLGAGPGCDGQALFLATDPIIPAEIPDSHAIDRERQGSLGARERNRGGEATGILQGCETRPGFRRFFVRSASRGAARRPGRAIKPLFQLANQRLHILGLARQLRRALALRQQVFLDFHLLFLARGRQRR